MTVRVRMRQLAKVLTVNQMVHWQLVDAGSLNVLRPDSPLQTDSRCSICGAFHYELFCVRHYHAF